MSNKGASTVFVPTCVSVRQIYSQAIGKGRNGVRMRQKLQWFLCFMPPSYVS